MANLVVESVPRDEVGVATGINTIMRSLGGALGAAVVAALLTGKTIAGSPIPAEAAYTDAFIVAAGAAGSRCARRCSCRRAWIPARAAGPLRPRRRRARDAPAQGRTTRLSTSVLPSCSSAKAVAASASG